MALGRNVTSLQEPNLLWSFLRASDRFLSECLTLSRAGGFILDQSRKSSGEVSHRVLVLEQASVRVPARIFKTGFLSFRLFLSQLDVAYKQC